MKPDVQCTNCSLALAVVRSFLIQQSPATYNHLTSSDIDRGMDQFNWPGRFQIVVENQSRWFLDGAHNEMSVVQAAEWYIKTSRPNRYNPLATYTNNAEEAQD